MMDELMSLRREIGAVAKAAATPVSTVDLEIKEERLRSGLAKEIGDEHKRREYRLQLDRLRANAAGRLWTASREHVKCGGVLPPRCATPVTPRDVQKQVLARMPVEEASIQVADPEEALPQLTLPLPRRRPPAGCVQLQDVEDSGTEPPAYPSELSESVYEESASAPSTESTQNELRLRNRVIRRGDVILAFELFRSTFWFQKSNAAKTHGDDLLRRRNQELDEILADAACDRGNGGAVQGCHSKVMTLKSFLRVLFPQSTSGDIGTMLGWIERSRQRVTREVRPKAVPTRLSQAATLLELVRLFDAIDSEHVGQVPLESVERFLCGELLTTKERERFQELEQSSRERPAFHFVDSLREPRGAHFLYHVAEDRREWSTFPTKARRSSYSGTSSPQGTPKTLSAQQHHHPPLSFSQSQQSSAGKVPQAMLCRVVGQHMERLARFLDRECRGTLDDAEERDFGSGIGCEAELIRVLDQASEPRPPGNVWDLDPALHPESPGNGGGIQKVRLPRLYWRYLVRCAMHQQLQDDEPCHLEVDSSGKIDLVGFMCILANDQLHSLFPRGQPAPTAELIRRIACAAQ